jgi:hypothetical protein
MADTPTNESSALDVLAKTGTGSKTGIVNQSILEDMQRLYDQKLAEKNYFLQDAADAAAWWSGGAAGPTAGLAQRAQTRAAQAKELQDLQAQLSQGRVNIAQLNEANTSMGEPQAGGAQATAGAPTGGYTIRGVPVPLHVYKAYQAYIKQGNLAKANEVFDAYSKEETKFLTAPATYKQEDYFDTGKGEMTRKMPIETRSLNNPNLSQAPISPVQPLPKLGENAKPTTNVSSGDIYRFENLGDTAKQRLSNYAKTELGLQSDTMNRPDASELFNRMPLEQRKNAFMKAGENPVMSNVAAPATTMSTVGGAPKTYSQYLTEREGQKSYAEKAGAESGKAAGTRQGAFESAAVDANKDLQTANVMLNILDKTPEAVGFGFKNRALGTTIEGIKFFTGKDIEPFARRASLSNEAIEAGNKFDALAEQNNLKFRQMVYKGTGQVSDFETKLSERASGLSKDNSVEANRFFATVAAENYRTLSKLGVEWQKYQKDNPSAKFSEFEQSNVWKDAQVERENRLKKYFPEFERENLGFGSKVPSKGASNEEVEGWKKRYGGKKED